MLSRTVAARFSLANPSVSSVRTYATTKAPVKVALTGAAGVIGYAALFRIASGDMLGKDQPIDLQLLELPHAMSALEGTIMELKDAAFPLLNSVTGTDDLHKAFDDIDYALLVGSKPRGPGQERGDLLRDNGHIFTAQGKALNAAAKRSVKVIVVGNPANTNALIAMNNAPDLPRENFTAMTRLDHNRGLSQLADKTGVPITKMSQFCVWGNHSPTMYPDITHMTIDGKPAPEVVNDQKWVEKTFIPDVQQRGAAIIKARGLSSAASAASAAIDHMRDWVLGTNGEWTSMAIPSNGTYGTPADGEIITSYPVVCENGEYKVVEGLDLNEFSQTLIAKSLAELKSERDAVAGML